MKAPLSAIPVAFGCVLAFAQPPAEQPAPQIQRAVHWRAAGVTTFELAGGINLHVRAAPRPGAGKVMIAAFVPGLELDETNADRGTAMLAAEALTPAQGEVRLRASLRPEGLLLTATCPAEKAPAALSQIAATLAAAVIDDKTFAEASGRLAAQFARQSERPEHRVAQAILDLAAPPGDPRLQSPTAAQLGAVTPAAARARLQDLFRSRAVDIAVVGDADAAALSRAAAQATACLPARERTTMTDRRSPAPRSLDAPTDILLTGARPMLAVSLPAPGIDALAESRLSTVAARLLEQQVADALRQAGLSVSGATGVSVPGRTFPSMGAVIGSFSLSGDDARLKQAAAIARARIAQLVGAGPTAADLQRAIDQACREIEPRLDTAEYWALSMAMAGYLRVPIDQLGEAPAAIRQTTRSVLRQHIARWWSPPQRVITVTVLPTPDASKP